MSLVLSTIITSLAFETQKTWRIIQFLNYTLRSRVIEVKLFAKDHMAESGGKLLHVNYCFLCLISLKSFHSFYAYMLCPPGQILWKS